MVNAGNFCEVFSFGAVSADGLVLKSTRARRISLLFHILSSSISEHLGGTWCGCDASSGSHHLSRRTGGIAPVLPEALQTSWHHLLKANDQDAVCTAMADDIARKMQTSRSSRAVVVDVVDWDLGHAELVEDSLSAG